MKLKLTCLWLCITFAVACLLHTAFAATNPDPADRVHKGLGGVTDYLGFELDYLQQIRDGSAVATLPETNSQIHKGLGGVTDYLGFALDYLQDIRDVGGAVAADYKPNVRTASTADLDITGTDNAVEVGDTIDGVVLATGDRVLIKNQTLAENNGIYTVTGESLAPTRATDADTFAELAGCFVVVGNEPTVAKNKIFVCSTTAGGTLGTDTITFTEKGAAGAGTGDALVASSLAQFAATTSAELAGVLSNETGTGLSVFATSPTFSTSLLTDSATISLFNATATTLNVGGAATTVNLGTSAAIVLNFGGSTTAGQFRFLEPSGSGTNYTAFKAQAQGANITYTLPATVGAAGTFLKDAAGDGILSWAAATGTGDALVANPLSQFAATTSAQLAGVLTNESGTGVFLLQTGPVLLNPQINDSANNTVLDVLGSASPINYLRITNADSGDGPIISALGADTDIDLTLTPKGAGSIVLNGPTSVGTANVTTVNATTITGAGGGITLTATGFDGNLTTTDNTIQEIAQKLDDLTFSGTFGETSLSTLVNNQTLWDGANASRTLTLNVSGTDSVITVSSGTINVSTGAFQVGGAAALVSGGALGTPASGVGTALTGLQHLTNGTDPDISTEGDISYETDIDQIRGYDGAAQVSLARKIVQIDATVMKPNDLADAQRDACFIWVNKSGMSFVVTGWDAMSDVDNTTLNIEESDNDNANNATVDAVEIATNGTTIFTGADTTITAGTIEDGHRLILDFDDTDAPGIVQITIYGYYSPP